MIGDGGRVVRITAYDRVTLSDWAPVHQGDFYRVIPDGHGYITLTT